MLKNIIATSLVASALLFSGCGDADGEARLAAQDAVDQGNFGAAIANIEAKPASQRTDSEHLTLASAYMGSVGLGFVDVITLMGTDDASTGSAGGFETFAKQIDDKKTPETLAAIDKAIESYKHISTVSAAPSRAISSTDGDAGLFLGIAYMTKATVVMSYFGNISELSNGGAVNAELQATADVIKYVYGGTGCATMGFAVQADGSVNVTTLSNKVRKATAGTNATTRGQLILTDYVNGNYAVDVDYTINKALISVINEGFEAIIDFAPDGVKDDIREYRDEMDKTPRDGVVSEEEIATYIVK